MSKKNQGKISHIALQRDCEQEPVSSSQSAGLSRKTTESSMYSFTSTDSSRNTTESSMYSFTTTDSSQNTSDELMYKKYANLEAQDSITANKKQDLLSQKTMTSSEHHKNMKKYYKKKENQIKLKLRLERYMVEMKLLEIKIKDLSSYLDICVCENKEDCNGDH